MEKITAKEVVGSIYQALEQDSGMSWIDQLVMKTTSNSASERYAWLGQSPVFREWLGPRLAKKLSEYDYTLRNKKYEATLEIAIDDMQRDKTGQLNLRINDFAARANAHWAKLITDLLVAGTAAGGECYDGQYFFDSDHSEGDSGTQTNLLTTTQATGLNVGTATAPTAAELAVALTDVIAYLKTYKDDQGEPINETASKWLVMCGNTKIYSPMLQASRVDMLANSTSVIQNVLRGVGLEVDVVMNPRLAPASWTTTFMIFRTDAPVKPVIAQQEGNLVVQTLAEGSDWEFSNDSHLFGLKTKRAAGYGFWQYAAHCTLS